MSLFITFEGVEGCGKSYQTRALFRLLTKLALPVILTHEPGGTSLGERVTRLVKWASQDIVPISELFLFNASRAQLVNRVIKPSLEKDNIVICDRFTDSTIAYQGYGRGLDMNLIGALNNVATEGLKPDLTILLDLPVGVGLGRKSDRKPDRFEQENFDFHRRVREGYLKLVADQPGRWFKVDATKSKNEVRRLIWDRVSKLLFREAK